MAQVTNYQCPACTGPLHFESASGKLECEHCGSTFSVEEIEALYAEKSHQAEESFAKKEEERTAEGGAEDAPWDTSGLSEDWGADAEGMRAYNCPSCGAELICDGTTAATSCPYCGNPSVVPGQFGGTLRPDLVIPFKLDKNAAVAALKAHYKGKYLLPKAFRKESHVQEIKGLYVPFWLYDAGADADCAFHATRSHTRRSGDYEITTTEHYDVRRSGRIQFAGVPADGSSKMPDDYMDSIEPFDYSELKPFSTAYLPGFLADRYDVSAEDNAERADERCKNSTIEYLRQDASDYDSVTLESSQFRLQRGRVRYVLLPVWTLVTKWKGKDYLFMMNGQTGKLVGDLPIDKLKLRLTFWGTVVGFAALTAITGLARALGGAVLG